MTRTNARQTPYQDRGAPGQASSGGGRRVPKPVAAALIAAALGVGVAWPALVQPQLDERHLSSATLEALQREQDRRRDDPRYLYHLGKRLNDATLHAQADPVLRRAVGLDPDSPRLREEWTRALLGTGLVTAAFGQLKEYAGTHPDSGDAQRILGKFYMAQKATDKAAESFTRATTLNPKDAEAWRLLATCLSDREAAIRAAKRGVELEPESADAHLTLASLLTQVGSFDEARASYARAVALAPSAADPHRRYAEFLLKAGQGGSPDVTAALEEARRAVAAAPQDAAAQLVLGQALLQVGRDAEAVPPLRSAAELDAFSPVPALALRQAFKRLGSEPEAAAWQKAYLERQSLKQQVTEAYDALRVDRNDRDARRKLARLLARQGDVRGALREHAVLTRAAQDAPPTLAAAANDLAAEGKGELALPLAERAVSIGAANPAAHEALGNVLLALGRSREAAVSYSKAVGFKPELYSTLMGRLRDHYAQRTAKATPAEQAFAQARRLRSSQIGPRSVTDEVMRLSRRAVALEPGNVEYLRFLLQNLVTRKDKAEAIKVGERLLEIAPRDGVGNALLAVLKADQATTPADWSEVEAHLGPAGDDPSMAPSVHYVRGLIALARAQADSAASELEEAVRLDPAPDVYHYKLAAAYRMAGRLSDASRVTAEYGRRNTQKHEQQAALERISLHPDKPELYDQAAKLFEDHGLPAQADAIRAEARRRFSGQRASGDAPRPDTKKGKRS